MVDRRLGRGLDFFLSGGRKSANPKATTPLRDKVAPDALAAVEEAGEHVRMIPVGQLKPNPYQPRRNMDEAELKTAGVSADLVRLSVGIEHIDDILADIEQALAAV